MMARPRIPLLSRQIIRDAALTLVDEKGLNDFSMRKLAAALSVQAPSLYSHYANKDELLDDVANTIMESVDVSGFASDDWRSALQTWGRSYRAALAAHPNIAPFLAYGPSLRPSALERANAIHGGLVRAGWPQRTATLIGASVKYLVVGAAMSTFSGGFVDDPDIYDERYPHLTRAHLLRERAAEIDGASFELALDSLLDGLEARHSKMAPRSQA
ncbi:TetR family transcriptional regulator [Rhodococcus sp. OK302]|nr:TetR family transcriptional regulator [Rhodococcus sp. OK302]